MNTRTRCQRLVTNEYSTNKLVSIALENGLSTLHDFDLNINSGDVDQSTHVVRLLNAQHYAQILSHFIMNNSTYIDIHIVIEYGKLLRRFRKMTIANSGRQHLRTLHNIKWMGDTHPLLKGIKSQFGT